VPCSLASPAISAIAASADALRPVPAHSICRSDHQPDPDRDPDKQITTVVGEFISHA